MIYLEYSRGISVLQSLFPSTDLINFDLQLSCRDLRVVEIFHSLGYSDGVNPIASLIKLG